MNYLAEWTNSGVDRQLTKLNVTPLEGQGPYQYLFYSQDIPRRNDGRVKSQMLKKYQHLEDGGWWCSGVDILTGQMENWGCFKPVQPRATQDAQKLIKYEHPPLAPTSIFALRVPEHLWQKIAARYQIDIAPTDIDPNQPDQGFWQWVLNHATIPICITEGAKKAGCLLTAGYVAIALPGIFGGYRVPRNEFGAKIGRSHLIPQLQKLATPGRQIYFAFDQDIKPRAIKSVHQAIRQTGYLLQEIGCSAKVITWQSELGKGVDDLIFHHGQNTFDQAYNDSENLDTWKTRIFRSLTYPVNFAFHDRYLPPLDFTQQDWSEYPETGELSLINIAMQQAQLIGIKSPKGSGKTLFLTSIVKQAIAQGKKILVIGHRVQLVEELCQKFGLQYGTGNNHNHKSDNQKPELNNIDKTLGMGLCIDSLHSYSQISFSAEKWSDCLIVMDEVEQVLWHVLNSDTCVKNRVAILKNLKILMQNIVNGNNQVFIADADLSDISIDYLIALSGIQIQPLIIQNEWQPKSHETWSVYHYAEPTPEKLLQDLEKHISDGGKPMVCLSAQKLQSKWGTRALEAYLTQRFPKLNILRIDSESLGDENHPAYGCISNLNQVLSNFDIVLASPAIETGVSIEIENHFTSVWAIAQGVQSENAVRQSLSRVRTNIPRYIWVAPHGFNYVGNGATSLGNLINSEQRLTKLNIRLLQESDLSSLDDLEVNFQAESLLCWAKMAVRLNATMLQYRQSILEGLKGEGHPLITIDAEHPLHSPDLTADALATDLPEINLTQEIARVIAENYHDECRAIAQAPDLTARAYKLLKKSLVKNPAQKRQQRKYELKLRYGLKVTPELVELDDQGWFERLQIHYFLTIGRSQLSARDGEIAKRCVQEGEGNIFLPDFNHNLLGVTIGIMELLHIPALLEQPERLFKSTDNDLQIISTTAMQYRPVIKSILGIGLAVNSTPITIVKRFLEKIGCTFQYVKSQTQNKKRVRLYQIVIPDDQRHTIFQYWQKVPPLLTP